MKFTGIVDSVPSRGGGGGLKIDPQMVEKTISELLAQSQDKMISIALEAGDHAASICGSFKRAEKRLDLKESGRTLSFRKIYSQGKGPVKGGPAYEPITLLVGWRFAGPEHPDSPITGLDAFDESGENVEGLSEQDLAALKDDPSMQLAEGLIVGENLSDQKPPSKNAA